MTNMDRVSEEMSDSWFNWQSSLIELPEVHGVEQQGDLWTTLFTTNVKGVEEMACPTKSCSISEFTSSQEAEAPTARFWCAVYICGTVITEHWRIVNIT